MNNEWKKNCYENEIKHLQKAKTKIDMMKKGIRQWIVKIWTDWIDRLGNKKVNDLSTFFTFIYNENMLWFNPTHFTLTHLELLLKMGN